MTIQLTEHERQTLREVQCRVAERSVYVKVTTVLMLSSGRSPASVADDLGIDLATVYRYAQAFADQGLAGYLQTHYTGYWGALSASQLSGLRQELNRTLHTDCKSIQAWLRFTYGVHYSLSGLTDLLHRLGYSYKQTVALPCEADADQQQAFLTEQLTPLLAAAEAGQAVVYFADAAHPTHNTRATHAWSEVGVPRPLLTLSGRDRVNLNAALNAHCPSQVHLHESDTVNAASTQALYQKLLAAHPDQGPIYVICDNARYYRNNALRAWLADKPLVQVFLPPYSPNLNLIERLWKFLRKKVINTVFYRTKEAFRAAILRFFDNLGDFRHELTSLLTCQFRVLDAQSNS